MKKHINLQVFGRVQGVGYRYSCVEIANKYEVKGFVKNKSDSSVYIEAEGEEDQLTQFTLWCHKGPVWAKVTSINETSGGIKDFDTFKIERTGY